MPSTAPPSTLLPPTASHGAPALPNKSRPVAQPGPQLPTTIPAVRAGDAGVAKSAAAPGVYADAAYPEQPGKLLSRRTTPSGISLTAYLQTWDRGEVGDPWGRALPNWKAAPWCNPVGNVRLSIVTPDAVNVAGASWFSEPRDGLAISSFAAGYVEGHPAFGVIAQVAADVTSVTLTSADGRTDSTAPEHGVALLAVSGEISTDVHVSATRSDGTIVDVTSTDQSQPFDNPQYVRACEPPPPALPNAGEQPADRGAAEAAIRGAFAMRDTVGSAHPADGATYIDDTTGVAGATKLLQGGDLADAARSATTTVQELVFTSPTEAWVRYDIVTSTSNFTNRYGQAHLAGGTWKLTRQTVCQDLALGAAGCAPAVEQLLPPSAATDPRYGQITDVTPVPIDATVTTATVSPGVPAPAARP